MTPETSHTRLTTNEHSTRNAKLRSSPPSELVRKFQAGMLASLRIFALIGLIFPIGCSTTVPLGTAGAKCEYDEQCSRPLVCRCIRKRSSDEEGPDEITTYGTCQPIAYLCPNVDAGVPAFDGAAPPDTGATDTGSTDSGSGDTASDAAPG